MQSFVTYLEKTVPDRLQRKFIEQVTNSTPDIIYVMDLEQRRIVFINDRVSTILGYEPEYFYSEGSKIFAKKLHPDDYLRRMQYITECLHMAEDETKSIDVRFRVKNGEWRWFRIRDIPFRVENSRVTQTVGIARDIHNLKTAEDELRHKELLLRSTVNLIPNPITAFKSVRNDKGEIIDFEWILLNEAAMKIAGQVRGERLTKRFPGVIQSGLFDSFKQVVETGRPFNMQTHYQYDNLERWIEIFAVKMNDGFVAVSYDLNEKERLQKEAETSGFKKGEGQIKASEEKFKALLESGPDAMVIIDATGTIDIVNAQLEHLLGYSRNELIGKKVEFLIPDRFNKVHQDNRNNFFIKPRTRAMGEGLELYAKRSDGKEIPVEISLSPLQTDKGLLVSAAIRDRTLQKKLQETALEFEKLSAIGSVSRTIAHEIRNPLTNITLAVQLLKAEGENKLLDSERLMELTQMILRNSIRIDQLLKDLIYRSFSGDDNFITIDILELMQGALDIASDRILLKEIAVDKNIEPICFIKADAEKMKIALLNIIINAIESMEPGKGKLRIIGLKENNEVMLSIIDNGCGMTKEQVEKIFETNYSTKPSGLGIGLANVKTILEMHDAKFKVMSEINGGTKFSIVFKAVG